MNTARVPGPTACAGRLAAGDFHHVAGRLATVLAVSVLVPRSPPRRPRSAPRRGRSGPAPAPCCASRSCALDCRGRRTAFRDRVPASGGTSGPGPVSRRRRRSPPSPPRGRGRFRNRTGAPDSFGNLRRFVRGFAVTSRKAHQTGEQTPHARHPTSAREDAVPGRSELAEQLLVAIRGSALSSCRGTAG